MEDHKKNLEKLIQGMGSTHSTWKVFEDFLEISAISVSNAVDRGPWDEREKEYLSIVSRYSKPELEQYHYTGQFFTPQHISEFMGKIAAIDVGRTIDEYGYCSVLEPASGSGTMVLGFAQAMKEQGYNYQKQLLAQAVDIDIRCVHMTYLQLSLYGIPAVVIHGNSLSMEEWSHWKTPMYLLGGWPIHSAFQQRYEEKNEIDSTPERGPEPIVLPTKEDKETGQFSFFQAEEELDEPEL